ncbi:DUF3455 domain-containing protein [Streptomyces sp. NPDC005423]|uniref:DUF3455 domain-containing protein n=1 Tax=Streptomyces sp. NPDC005423 TaxID=3155343 RepID=UPI0033B8B9D8
MGRNATFAKSRKSLTAAVIGLTAVAGAAAGAVPSYAQEDPSGGGTVLAASLRGADEGATALEFVRVEGDRVSVAVTWHGTGRPAALRIHQGDGNAAGDVTIDFGALLRHSAGHTVTGTVEVTDAALLGTLTTDPGAFSADLTTTGSSAGALHGRLHHVSTPVDFRHVLGSFQAPVVEGQQIYECKPTDAGGYAFAQRDVSAALEKGIAHSYVQPNSGVPQWVAPDGSAVTGTVVAKTPNGTGNIPEVELAATRSGAAHGLLSRTAAVLRLNTVGGVAPAGSCTPGAIVGVPYHADYVFVQG